MSDPIDRRAVMIRVREYLENPTYTRKMLLDDLKNLPSVQPERKKGKWIDETFKQWGLVHHPYKCDQCGNHSEVNSNFCPECGCDMRGEQK